MRTCRLWPNRTFRRPLSSSGARASLLLVVGLLGAALATPDLAHAQGDAYGFSDSFDSSAFVDLVRTSEFVNVGGSFEAVGASSVLSSVPITLALPPGAVQTGWSFVDLTLENVGGASVRVSLEAPDGTVLATRTGLVEGCNVLDVSAVSPVAHPTVRLVVRATYPSAPALGAGVRVSSWRVTATADGPTRLEVASPATVPIGDTLTFEVQVSSSGGATRGATAVFSLDDLNGLGRPVDDGLAQDAREDYGNGGGLQTFRPVTFVSASAGPGGVAPMTPAVGATSGEVRWSLGTLNDGTVDTLTVTVRVPTGTANNKTIAGRAQLSHGPLACDGRVASMVVAADNRALPTTARGFTTLGMAQYDGYAGSTGPNVSLLNRYIVTMQNRPDATDYERGIFEFRNVGTCPITFEGVTPSSGMPAQYTRRQTSAHVVGTPITDADPLRVQYDRYRWQAGWGSHTQDIIVRYRTGDCAEGSQVRLRATWTSESPAATRTLDRTLGINTNTCRTGYTRSERMHNGALVTSDFRPWINDWPERIEIESSSIAPGQFWTAYLPFGSEGLANQTVTLDQSYYVFAVPSGASFHGFRAMPGCSGSQCAAYKDCTGSARLPTDPAFDHLDPRNSGWSRVTTTWGGPFVNPPSATDPSAVVPPGCRMMTTKANDAPLFLGGSWHPQGVFLACDNTHCPVQLPGSSMGVAGRIYTHHQGVTRDCSSVSGNLISTESLSWPAVFVESSASTVPAGGVVRLTVNPENANRASTFPRARWAVDFSSVAAFVDLDGITGRVDNPAGTSFPDANRNVAGQSCDLSSQIVFRPPSSATCTASGALGCFGYFEVADACQPPNGWGRRDPATRPRDNYVQSYRFVLDVPVRRTTPAGTALAFQAQVRRTDMSALGADNVPATSRWPLANYTGSASVSVTPVPGLDLRKTGPSTWPASGNFSYNFSLSNIGNVPLSGAFLVDRLPRAGDPGGTTSTPAYGSVFLDRADATVWTSGDATCFDDPFGVSWDTLTLVASARPGFVRQTSAAVPAAARCVGIAPSSLASEETMFAALDVTAPPVPEALIVNRALAGASPSVGGTITLAPVQSRDVQTVVRAEARVSVEKSVVPDETRAGHLRYTLLYRNVSGVTSSEVSLEEIVPSNLEFVGFATPLTASQSCRDAGCALVGDRLRFSIASLSPDDGNPGTGSDEGTIRLWMRVRDGVPAGTTIQNCARVTPQFGVGGTGCVDTTLPQLTVAKAAQVVETSSTTAAVGGETIRYRITATNTSTAARFLRIYDALDPNLRFVSGSLRVDGAVASDTLFSGGAIRYVSPAMLAPGATLELVFSATVAFRFQGFVDNTVVVTPCSGVATSSCQAAVAAGPARISVTTCRTREGAGSHPGCDNPATPYCRTSGPVPECVSCLVPTHCDDANGCTTDACSAAGFCSHTPVAAGSSCAGGVCTSASACETCIDTSSVGTDLGCSAALPYCTGSAGRRSCIECIDRPGDCGDGRRCIRGVCAPTAPRLYSVEAVGFCNQLLYEPEGGYVQVYDSTTECEPGWRPVWGALRFDVDTPAETSVEFQIRTAPTRDGLLTAMPASIVVPPGSSPARIDDALRAARLTSNDPFLSVAAVLRSNASRTRTPTLFWFEVDYECRPLE